MRKLRKIKVMFSEKKGTSYHIAWKSSEDGDVWERHALESNDYPRPEFKQAISRMAFILVNACDIKMPDNEILSRVDITSIALDDKDDRKVTIGGDVLLMNGNSIRLNDPQLYCREDGGMLERALTTLKLECFGYIDGDRAQMQLFRQGMGDENNEDEEGKGHNEGGDKHETVSSQTES